LAETGNFNTTGAAGMAAVSSGTYISNGKRGGLDNKQNSSESYLQVDNAIVFETTDTKLKELSLKYKNAEKERLECKREISRLNKKIVELRGSLQDNDDKFKEFGKYLTYFFTEWNNSFDKYLNPDSEKKREVNTKYTKAFKLLGTSIQSINSVLRRL